MFKAVLFDFGQTLVDSAEGFRTAEKEAQQRIIDDLHRKDSLAFSQESFLKEYRRLRRQFQEESNFSRKSLWQAVYFHFGRQTDEAVLQRWEEDYWQRIKAMTNVFPETSGVLESLHEKYRLGLITNTQAQPGLCSHRLAEFPELEGCFDAIVVAGEEEVSAKPDPAPFRLCLQQLHVEADKAVFVGDDWLRDVCGARTAGLHAIWLKHHAVPRNWPQVETDVPVITSLMPLLDLEKVLA